MGTRFEVVLSGEDPVRLRSAAEAALDEVDRLDAQLSTYKPTSELSRINARAGREAVLVEPMLFNLFLVIERIYHETQGAFDPTVKPLMETWGFVRGTGRLPVPDALAEAKALTGMDKVTLDRDSRTIRFRRDGMRLDLGGVGKGYALEEAARILGELGVDNALIHGGTSTVCAIGRGEDDKPWQIAVPYPSVGVDLTTTAEEVLSVVGLENTALSVSAIRGKAFEANGKIYGHILDPRIGEPVQGAHLAAVITPSGMLADALSTAMLVLGEEGPDIVINTWPDAKFLVVMDGRDAERLKILQYGLPLEPADH